MKNLEKIKKLIYNLCCVSLLVVFLCPTSALASIKANADAQKDIDIVLSYTTVYADGRVEFDSEAAIANEESDEILEIGKIMGEFADAYYSEKQGISTQKISFPIYGNWCGPAYGEGNGKPIDALDAACKAHDDCYGEKGYFNCTCDSNLIDTIDSKIEYMTGDQLSYAKAIKAYFSVAPCNN